MHKNGNGKARRGGFWKVRERDIMSVNQWLTGERFLELAQERM